MFFEISENIDFGEYANNNSPYTYCSKIEHVLTNLHGASKKKTHLPVFWKPLGSKRWKMPSYN